MCVWIYTHEQECETTPPLHTHTLQNSDGVDGGASGSRYGGVDASALAVAALRCVALRCVALRCVALRCVPGEQQGGAGAQRADQVHGQLPPLVVGQREASLDVLQRADVLGPPPAGVHAPAEHQLVADVPAGWTGSGGGRESGRGLLFDGCRRVGTKLPSQSTGRLNS